MRIIGAWDDDEEDLETESTLAWPLTFKGTVDYFRNEARKCVADGDVARLRGIISRLHKSDGLSYDEIQGMVRYFFERYGDEVTRKNTEYSAVALFQQRLQQVKNSNTKPITQSTTAVLDRAQDEIWKALGR